VARDELDPQPDFSGRSVSQILYFAQLLLSRTIHVVYSPFGAPPKLSDDLLSAECGNNTGTSARRKQP